ncbi:MAG: DUF5916 domain-containing protein [Spirosomataceae bacterium]
MKFRNFIYILIFSLINIQISAQDNRKAFHIRKSNEPIKLDGKLTEAVWQAAETVNNFFLNKPFDTSFAKSQTEVKMTFDDKFLYVSMVAWQKKADYTISSFKRDFESGSSDVFSINIDAFGDQLNGMQFGVSPLNVQREGLISLGEETDYSWDNKWFSVVSNHEDHWVLEVAIPFTTLRYKVRPSGNVWRVNFGRFFMKTNEVSTWSPVPRNFRPNNLAYTGDLIWDDNPPEPGVNISLIPYISGGYAVDFPRGDKLEELPHDKSTTKGIGMDAKVAITPSLNLDLTINPDFSQVEVDAQQTNLSRFELFFPEKRQFFIENSDLFDKFGFPGSRPFFSRRIGLTENPFTHLVEQVPIIAGARLSGKLNKDWRIGLMNMQTAKVNKGENKYLPATNYAVGVLQRQLFTRSYIGVIGINKETIFGNIPESSLQGVNKFNRLLGLEFNYYSPDNRLETESYYHQTFSPTSGKDASTINQYIGYHHPHLDVNLGVARIGKDFQSEVGFTPRTGVYTVYRPITIILNPKNKRISKYINAYGIGMEGSDVFDLKGKRLDTEQPVFLFLNTPAEGELSGGYYMAYTYLYEPFDPTNASENPNPDFQTGIVPVDSGGYKMASVFINVKSPKKYNFSTEFLVYHGTYFGGKNTGIESKFSYRIQPYGRISMDLFLNDIHLPKPHNSARYWLIGPKAEVSFSKSLFLNTYFQYNSQTNNTNINTRIQWRYKPVSDIFLVYTDNYFAEEIPRYRIQPWTPKNRAIILKMTYWLNL